MDGVESPTEKTETESLRIADFGLRITEFSFGCQRGSEGSGVFSTLDSEL